MNTSTKPTENTAECGNKSKPLLAVVFSDFFFPKYTKWIDIQLYDSGGHYKLVQMKIRIRDNKKIFRTNTLGFINDYTVKYSIRQRILNTNVL